MRRGLLATLFLLGAACFVQADYIVITADLNAKLPSPPPLRGPLRGQPPPPPPGPGGAPAANENPNPIVAVVRVEGPQNGYMKSYKQFGKPVSFHHSWGKIQLWHTTPVYTTEILEKSGAVIPSVTVTFKEKHDDLVKKKGGVEVALAIAKWALEHGLLDQFAKVMDKLAETDKANPSVAAYIKVKAALARPVSDGAADKGMSKLLAGYQIHNDLHYVLFHGVSATDGEVKSRLDQLEKSLRAYYYWWACQGIALPAPKERLTAVLTDKDDDFNRLDRHLTAGSVVCDSFYARRENLAVFANKRGDEPYTQLMGFTQPKYWETGYSRYELLSGKAKVGYPKGKEREDPNQILLARTYALMLKAMENEWEQTSTGHQASRQLVFASGLLPNNVNVPEWIQFGMGSFFETPRESPWAGGTAANCYWLPRFREYLAKTKDGSGYEASHRDTLIKVITDGYFRDHPSLAQGSGSQYEMQTADQGTGEVRGQAASWSLAFFLAKTELEGLQRYFRELSSMPRDVELDDKVLIAAFARAFDCLDANKQVDNGKLGSLAERWIGFIGNQRLEEEGTHKKIRQAQAKMKRPVRRPMVGRRPAYRPGIRPGARPPVRPAPRPVVPGRRRP